MSFTNRIRCCAGVPALPIIEVESECTIFRPRDIQETITVKISQVNFRSFSGAKGGSLQGEGTLTILNLDHYLVPVWAGSNQVQLAVVVQVT